MMGSGARDASGVERELSLASLLRLRLTSIFVGYFFISVSCAATTEGSSSQVYLTSAFVFCLKPSIWSAPGSNVREGWVPGVLDAELCWHAVSVRIPEAAPSFILTRLRVVDLPSKPCSRS